MRKQNYLGVYVYIYTYIYDAFLMENGSLGDIPLPYTSLAVNFT
jgi:hypothetical protein